MDSGEIATLAAVGVTAFGSIGATVRWAALQFREQGRKLAKLEGEYAALYREHSLVLVRLERFRLAFQMVAAELSRKSPGNVALVHAKALLDESFRVDPEAVEERNPPGTIDEAGASQNFRSAASP